MSDFFRTVEEFKEGAGYEEDGRWYPRVTSILSIKSKPALYRYYASMPDFKTGQEVANRSAVEGTSIHNIIEKLLKKESVTIPSSVQPSIDAFLEFQRNNDIKPLKIEERVVSRKHGYAGTIDVLAEVNGQLGVFDIKTSKGIYRDYHMQTAAYVEAFKEDPNLPPLTSWIFRIDQIRHCNLCNATLREKGGNHKVRGSGTFCPHEWSEVQGEYEFQEVPNFEHNIKAFLAAKILWEWEHHEWISKLR